MEKNKKSAGKRKPYVKVFLQILLMIGMTFSFCFFVNESLKSSVSSVQVKYQKKNSVLNLLPLVLRGVGKLIFSEKSFASALTEEDRQKGAFTCLKSKDGKICQSYPASECKDKCTEECIPTSANEVSQCTVGTCYNQGEGTCSLGAPKAKCESDGGKWFSDVNGNIPECKPGCCILGSQAYLGTAKQCEKDSAANGVKKDFRPEANTEIACIALAKTQEEGACVFQQENENSCKFTNKLDCLQGIRGKFYSGYLCSNPELKTNCKAQQTAKCSEGKDEVYWYDSCGNRENIYDANKVKSFNLGKILAKEESCSLSSSLNPFANQGRCGNCNYLLGSVCGKKSANEKLSDGNFDAVCKDLSCKDENGQRREHGESWCAYQGAVGVDKNRGADSVGSRDFKKICINGEVKTDACADYRNEICVQADTKLPSGKTFSSAACRINLGYTCYDYNKEGKKDQCEKNPDCFIKKVDVSKNFNFDFCLPKYKPGFDLETRGEGAEEICKIGTQNCKVIYVKELNLLTKQGEWKCKANCECEKAKFAEQMNDFCMSLGDCGAQVNYQGTLTENYRVGNSPKLGQTYINGIKLYSNEELYKGKFAEAGNVTALYNIIGIPADLGSAISPGDPLAQVKMLTYISGAVGALLPIIAHNLGAASALQFTGLTATYGSAAYTSSTAASLSAVGGALAGAAVGFSMTSFLLEITGVGRGLPEFVVYSLLAAGTVAGAIIGYYVILGGLAAVPIVGWIIAIVVLIVIAYLTIIGIGKKKEVNVSFTCQPWQAPAGGADCGKCGKDGLPCSKYACQSLGQTCQYINEETGNPECIAIEKNDSAPPEIRGMKELLPEGYKTEEFESGIKIKSSAEDGCISETNNPIPFGIALNEPGQCKMEFSHTNSFEEMEQDLAGRSLFLKNHTLPLTIPSLESLGLEGFDPRAKIDFNIYVRCQDKNGNKNEKEYNINTCIKQGPDATPAIVTGRDPASEILSFNASEVNATIYTSEPAECRWDSSDKEYGLMKNQFNCENGIENRKLLGWTCSSVLPIQNNENGFYVRCLDQPWLAGLNESARNANKESYQLKFRRSASALKIDSLKPDNETLSFATEPASITLEAKTSGGADGNARCSYQIGSTQFIEFKDTLTNNHKQVLQSLFSGDVQIRVKCQDFSGNVVESTASFKIKIDAEAPKVSRVYKQNGNLVVITNEDAECSYSVNQEEQCLFDMTNKSIANSMTDSVFIHSTVFNEKDRYYIKCKDKLGNYPGDCSIIAKEGKV